MVRRAKGFDRPPPTASPRLSTLPKFLAVVGALLCLAATAWLSGTGSGLSTGAVRGVAGPGKRTHSTAVSKTWAGYAVEYPSSSGNEFSDVSGSWVQPAVTCPVNQLQESAFWVGIDGAQKTADTVEQVGTDSDCDKGTKKKPGGPTYYGWYELYPESLVPFGGTVEAGDQMTADVSRSGSTFTFTLTDTTQGWSDTTSPLTPSTTTPNSSAEWVVEAPSSKLADFGSVEFSDISADANTLPDVAFDQFAITMAKGKTVRAIPSALSGDGFTVTWEHN
jgi:hypothetical protein